MHTSGDRAKTVAVAPAMRKVYLDQTHYSLIKILLLIYNKSNEVITILPQLQTKGHCTPGAVEFLANWVIRIMKATLFQ